MLDEELHDFLVTAHLVLDLDHVMAFVIENQEVDLFALGP